MKNFQHKIPRILILVIISLLLLSLVTIPAIAEDDNSDNNEEDSIKLCDEKDGATETASTIRNIFTIMSVLGPVFATLFFVGMSVADAATVKEKYKEQRRKVLLLGFGVPVAISFLSAIAGQILDQDISCFFP